MFWIYNFFAQNISQDVRRTTRLYRVLSFWHSAGDVTFVPQWLHENSHLHSFLRIVPQRFAVSFTPMWNRNISHYVVCKGRLLAFCLIKLCNSAVWCGAIHVTETFSPRERPSHM